MNNNKYLIPSILALIVYILVMAICSTSMWLGGLSLDTREPELGVWFLISNIAASTVSLCAYASSLLE